MYIKLETSPICRNNIVCTDESLKNYIGFENEDSYFSGHISIVDVDNDEFEEKAEIGEVCFHAFNLDKCGCELFEGDIEISNLYDIMDSISGDEEVYCSIFEMACKEANKKMEKYKWSELFMRDNLHLVTLDRLYINENYRHNGLSKYILSNLEDILRNYYNIETFMIVGICSPDVDDEKNTMLEIQKKGLKNLNFSIGKLGSDTIFYKLIATDYE